MAARASETVIIESGSSGWEGSSSGVYPPSMMA
jgi:hypothetical protein